MHWKQWGRSTTLTAAVLSVVGVQLEAQKAKTVDLLCSRLLPVEVANRLTDRRDLQLIPRLSIAAAGGTCNYAADGKKMVFLVTVLIENRRATEEYARYKGQVPYTAHQRDVAGLGDAAFTGGEYDHLLVARAGSRVVLLGAMLAMDKSSRQLRAMASLEQLIALAREVIAKL